MEQRRRPKRRSRRKVSPLQKFLYRYFPSLCLVGLSVLCVGTVIFTIQSISGMVQNAASNIQTEAPAETEDPLLRQQLNEILAQAEKLAGGYDYLGAIDLLETFPDHASFPEITGQIDAYRELDSQLVSYSDLDNITHLFFHSLIADPVRAFDNDADADGYNLYMVTVAEFKAILQQMYDRGYVLVSPYDIAYENENGKFVYGNIRLPEGKTPFLMSQDDVNYYSYMIGTGSGVNETPIFADKKGDGFACRIIIGEDGFPTCEYVDANGNLHVGDYDLVPILERFIQEHPDFSYHGARAILGVTGYEGVFGYRTKPSYEAALGTARYQQEVENAKAVAECLKEHGWILASHSYGHPAYGNLTPDRVEADSDKWETTCQYIIGETDILLFPHGSDISGVKQYTMDNEKFAILYAHGYRYFFNVDSKVAWSQVGTNYFRGSRRNIDGYRMYHNPGRLADLFDVETVFDPARPTPVPSL